MNIQFDPKQQYQLDAVSAVVDILDRIIHRAHRIELRGESMRNPPQEPER